MDVILRAAVRTLHATGITSGVVPDGPCRHGDVAFVMHPGDAVEQWYEDKTLLAGVSIVDHTTHIGNHGLPVDVLLGWIEPTSKMFRWAFQNTNALPVPLLSRQNMLDILADIVNNVPLTASPVWLTIGDIAVRDEVLRAPDTWPCVADVYDDMLAAERRAHFWSITYEEFIQRTWHPARVFQWCLDSAEQAELFQMPI